MEAWSSRSGWQHSQVPMRDLLRVADCQLLVGSSHGEYGEGKPSCISYVCVQSHFSHFWLFATPWTVVHQAPQSFEFSRQEYWSGLPFPPPWDLPDLGIEPTSPTSSTLAGRFFTTSATLELLKWKWKSLSCVRLFAAPWTVQSLEFSRLEYWSG